jgi:hypothetical protein
LYFTSYFRLFKYMVSFSRYFTVCITYQLCNLCEDMKVDAIQATYTGLFLRITNLYQWNVVPLWQLAKCCNITTLNYPFIVIQLTAVMAVDIFILTRSVKSELHCIKIYINDIQPLYGAFHYHRILWLWFVAILTFCLVCKNCHYNTQGLV